MRVIVTRPRAQALTWVQHLSERGVEAVALPLIAIAPPADASVVAKAWRELGTRRLAVFVSPNAAQQFFADRPDDAVWPTHVAAASIGPGTTRSLLRLGVPPALIIEPSADAPQFDSEALWQRLVGQTWSGASVLIVRGDGGREWLATTLRDHGAMVDTVSAYRRCAPAFDEPASEVLKHALLSPRDHLWFFSSSEAISHLLQARPDEVWSEARALTTHPRIADRAEAAGFGQVHASRPTLEAVVACIQSIAS